MSKHEKLDTTIATRIALKASMASFEAQKNLVDLCRRFGPNQISEGLGICRYSLWRYRTGRRNICEPIVVNAINYLAEELKNADVKAAPGN